MAMAGAKFSGALIDALEGASGVTVCTYVKSNVMDGCEYFASPVTLGKNGVETIHPVGETSDREKELLKICVENLQKNIQTANDFLASY